MPTLEITTMVGCPLTCTFCPQDSLKTAYSKHSDKYMSWETFRTILAKVPKTVRIDFSGMAEPWANQYATDMLRLTLQSGYQVAIYTTLYGMSVENSVYIINELIPQFKPQIEIICLHLPDANMNMRGYKGSPEYRQVLTNFLNADYPVQAMTMDKSGQMHPDLVDIVPRLGDWNGHSRAGSLGEEQTKKVGAAIPPRNEFRVSCKSTAFYDHNVLLPDGSVCLCCMDYNLKVRLGSLLTQDYYDLFISDELNKLRILNQKPEFSKCSICKSCENVIRH